MFTRLKQVLSGQKPREEIKAREEEITTLRHEIKNSIHAVRSGHHLLQTMSGVIDLNKRSPR